MPTPSAKTKSPHGNSGPDAPPDSPEYREVMDSPEMAADCEKPPTPEPCQPAAAVVVDSADTAPLIPMSEADRKLATRMTKAIADQLGLSGRTRSVRV